MWGGKCGKGKKVHTGSPGLSGPGAGTGRHRHRHRMDPRVYRGRMVLFLPEYKVGDKGNENKGTRSKGRQGEGRQGNR